LLPSWAILQLKKALMFTPGAEQRQPTLAKNNLLRTSSRKRADVRRQALL
jgi:hypothetical protein